MKYFMTILMVAVTTFFVSCANPSTIMPETPVTPVTPVELKPQEPQKPIQHYDEKVLWEGYEYFMYIQADMFENTGDVLREIQVTYSARDVDLMTSLYFDGYDDNKTKYRKGTWTGAIKVTEYNQIVYTSTDTEDKVVSYLPTQDEWNMMKVKGIHIAGSNKTVKKVDIKEI